MEPIETIITLERYFVISGTLLLILFIAYILQQGQPLPLSLKQTIMPNNYQEVYTVATTGTPNNDGLPPTLAALVAAQAQHESANFTSPVFKNSNNAFGYGYDAASQYQTGQYEQYAAYASLDDSAAEIVDYIYRRVADGSFPADLTTITTPLQYATLLKNAKLGAYFADTITNYANGIASYLSQDGYGNLSNNAAPLTPAANPGTSTAADLGGLLLIIGLGVGLYYLFK